MGLRALEPGDWLWRDRHLDVELAERRRLVASDRNQVIAALPGSIEACVELLQLVCDNLARFHGSARVAPGNDDPLAQLAELTQEDWCLLQAGADERYHLRAGVLCFPLHWRLREKLGQSLNAIHGPVPDFADKLGGAADRFFTALAADRPVWRANWTLTEKPDLHQPGRREPVSGLDSDNAGQRLWLRIERQTLRRLPVSGAIAFGIRTLVRPLEDFAGEPAVCASVAARIREMPVGMAVYKGIPLIREPLLAWLDERAEQAIRPPPPEPAGAEG